MKKQEESALSNTRIAIVFFIFLILVVGLSLTFKAISIMRAGQFDDSKRFTLVITNDKNTEVISLSPDSKNIAIFKFNGIVDPIQAGRHLEIPIDAFIIYPMDLNQKPNSLFVKAIFSYNNLKTNLTIIDLLKLALFVRTIPENSISTKIVGDINNLESIVGRLATDNLIEKDRQTIQIINGTDTIGLGNRLARLITNMGGDVIIVTTSDNPRKKSMISYIDKKTYTVGRLQKVLGFDAIKEADNAISDITIVIGEDKVDSLPF